MICRKCGKQIPDGSRFCPSCGIQISMENRSTSSAPPDRTGDAGYSTSANGQYPSWANTSGYNPQPPFQKKKKPITEKWWFWSIIAIVFVVTVIAAFNEGRSSTTKSIPLASPASQGSESSGEESKTGGTNQTEESGSAESNVEDSKNPASQENEPSGEGPQASETSNKKLLHAQTISCSSSHTVAVRADGTVVAVGDNFFGECDVSGWRDIVSVAAGDDYTVGLHSDGTVVFTIPDYETGYLYTELAFLSEWADNLSEWTDIVSVAAGDGFTVGLRSDGTVVATGDNSDGQCDVLGWTDIIAVAVGGSHTLGLRSDGTVVTAGEKHYAANGGLSSTDDWTDIVAIATSKVNTVGLRSDGTLVTLTNDLEYAGLPKWTDIVAVAAARHSTIGLRSDGTVYAGGTIGYDKLEVSGWTNIVAVAAGDRHTVGLRSDGTVVAVGSNSEGQCDVSGWTDIKLPYS